MEHDPKAIYRATVRIEVPVLFTASAVPEGMAAAIHEMETGA